MFLRNVGRISTDCMVPYERRLNSSKLFMISEFCIEGVNSFKRSNPWSKVLLEDAPVAQLFKNLCNWNVHYPVNKILPLIPVE
jgi:hypothetical protein